MECSGGVVRTACGIQVGRQAGAREAKADMEKTDGKRLS